MQKRKNLNYDKTTPRITSSRPQQNHQMIKLTSSQRSPLTTDPIRKTNLAIKTPRVHIINKLESSQQKEREFYSHVN